MAYVSKQDKAKLAPGIKAVLKKYNMKGTIAVQNMSTLVVNIKSGDLDIIGAHRAVAINDNRYDHNNRFDVEQLNYVLAREYDSYMRCPAYTGVVGEFFTELFAAMEGEDFFNEDDAMTDYFHRSHYTEVNFGKYDKGYECTGVEQTFEPVKVLEFA